MAAVLIIGAGAVGRGFVAPLMARGGYEIDFVDSDPALVETLCRRDSYTTAVTAASGYRFDTVPVRRAKLPRDIPDVKGYDLIFVSVGVRNYIDYAPIAAKAGPIFVLENIRNAASRLRRAASSDRIYFGIPDVIISNIPPPELAARDSLCLVAEQGELFVEDGVYDLPPIPSVTRCNKTVLAEHWACKFFIHSACHAVAAYLGALRNYSFIHEAVTDAGVGAIVEQAMRVVCEAMIENQIVSAEYGNAYLARELMRFRNVFLFDQIKRVARDPLRKLDRDDRLVTSLRIVERAGLDSMPFVLAINAALSYCNSDDESQEGIQGRRPPEEILRTVCGIEDEESIRRIMSADPRNNYAPNRARAASQSSG